MSRAPEGLARFGDKLVLGVCVAISLLLITSDDATRLRLGSTWAHRLTTPVEMAASKLDYFADVRSENERLRTRIAAMELDAAHILAERGRIEELRARAGFFERSRGHLVPARVIEFEMGRFPTYAKIRCNPADSLEVWQAVVTERGLVGRILEVLEPNLATVELITNLDSRISVEDVRTGVLGLLRYDGRRYLMDHVPRGEPVERGDVVHTSGLGQTVPRGLPVGTVAEIRSSPSELFQQIELTPAERVSTLDEVYVVLREGPWYVRPGDADTTLSTADVDSQGTEARR